MSGFKRRIDGVQLGTIGAGLSKTLFGMTKIPLVWMTTQFCSSLNFPILGSSFDAILLVQGRVFATRSMVGMIVSALGY